MAAQPNTPLVVRPATDFDVPAITAIVKHYVEHSVVHFGFTPDTEEEILLKWKRIQAAGLPFVVAALEGRDGVVGFGYATGFRGERSGYRHTVEVSVFCHPEHTALGIGTRLLSTLLDILKTPAEFPDYVPTPRAADAKVRMVIACMAVDETAWKGGLGLKNFYEKFGFEQVGHLPKVGHKFGRWIDTIYMQRVLW
jgi:phosphinothricin acetyltransferase